MGGFSIAMLNYQRVFPKTCQLLALCYPLLLRYAISQPGDVFIHLCATKLPRRSCASHTLRWNATSPKISFLAPNHFGKYGFPNFFPFQEPFGYGSIPINTIFRGMNVHLPAILMFTRGTRFWHTAISLSDNQHLRLWARQLSTFTRFRPLRDPGSRSHPAEARFGDLPLTEPSSFISSCFAPCGTLGEV